MRPDGLAKTAPHICEISSAGIAAATACLDDRLYIFAALKNDRLVYQSPPPETNVAGQEQSRCNRLE